MRPLSRRHGGGAAFSPLSICLALLFLFAATARAAVLGIDFGTLNIKAALIKPGVPLDIVLTKDSKRKEVAALAFKPNRDEKNQIIAAEGTFPERAYGSDALALQGRFPSEVFPNLKFLLGLPSGDEAAKTTAIYKERYPALNVEFNEDAGTTVIRSTGFTEDEAPFTVEELVGMELANIRRNAESMAGKGSVVNDAVITIPPFYTAEERRAIVRAAAYAGLKVNALISDGLAVGLDYAKTRTFPEVTKGEKPEYHLVFDMGAGSTSATLLQFQSRSVKDIGRFNKTVQEVAVVGAGWDRTLGGDSLNQVIMDHYIDKLMSKSDVKSRGTTIDEVKSNGRTMGRFFKEAERARQILSANSDVSSSFEEILPDVDLRTKLSRTEFETLVADFADRVEQPIKDALSMAKLTMKDVGSIILHGGAVRTPFVQTKLEKIAGDAGKLRNNVNADESAVFGAAFKAAGLSASFKVKEIRDYDIAGYTTVMHYTDKEKAKQQNLFLPSSHWGSGSTTKQVSLKDKEDFALQFSQLVEGASRPVLKAESVNLTLSVQELNRKFGCEPEEISTKVSVRLSSTDGLPEVAGGSVSCEVEGNSKSSVGDTVKDWLGFGKKKDQEPLGEDADIVEDVDAETASKSSSAKSSDSASSTASDAAKASESPKKRTEIIQVQWSSAPVSNSQPSEDDLSRVKERLVAFDNSDLARVAREEALNLLESYSYYVRDLLENTDYEEVSTQEQRGEIGTLLATIKEWMELPGSLAKATIETLTEKRSSLQKLVDPVVARRKEGQQRPELLKTLKDSLEQTGKLLTQMESQIAAAVEAKSKAAELEKDAQKSPSEDAAAAASSEFADLDDAETTTPPAPKYSDPSDFNPYANIDLTSIKSVYDNVREWLSEKEAAQESLKPFDDPVLRIKDIELRASQLGEAMRDLVYKQMKAASKTSSASKKAKATKSKASKKAKGTSTSSQDEAETPVAEAIPSSATESLAGKKPVDADISIEELLGSNGGFEKDEL